MTKSAQDIKEILAFVKANYRSFYKEADLKKAIIGHLKFGTYIVLKDSSGIAAVCRWNVRGPVAEVLDLIIRKDASRKGLIKYVTAMGWKKFPYLKWIAFEREMKYPGRPLKYYPIKRFVGRS